MTSEIFRLDAKQIAQMIKEGEVSCGEVVEIFFERIEKINHKSNALTAIFTEPARRLASKLDKKKKDEKREVFHGVPFTIKENIDFYGIPTTKGMPAFKDSFPSRSDPIVTRLIAAGGIPIGKTNMPEMGMRLDTDNPLFGRTLNPWNQEITSGGSSGGEAVALATGMTPFGIGNDIGGSLRNPAYCCGISALKPSQGLVPWSPSIDPIDLGIPNIMLTNGPMARTISDLKVGLKIMQGRSIFDPDSLDILSQESLPRKPKAGFVMELNGFKIPEVTLRRIEESALQLEKNGWQISEVSPPEINLIFDVWISILRPLLDSLPIELFSDKTARYLRRVTKEPPPYDLAGALLKRRMLRRLWSDFFKNYTVLIGPTWCTSPWPIDTDLDPVKGDWVLKQSSIFIAPGNCLGIPAIAMPHESYKGIPTGIQIYADMFKDHHCLYAAEIIEGNLGKETPFDPDFLK
ncbi:MAG: amidase family protein [Pseudomonadota bacterium]|nr:amidase family protein [Pseudomonadota bacterium]